MNVKFGDMDITKQILENEFNIACMDIILGYIMAHNHDLDFPKDMNKIRKEALGRLQAKYPNSDIKLVKKMNKHEIN